MSHDRREIRQLTVGSLQFRRHLFQGLFLLDEFANHRNTPQDQGEREPHDPGDHRTVERRLPRGIAQGFKENPAQVKTVQVSVMPNKKPSRRVPAATAGTRQYPIATVAPRGKMISTTKKIIVATTLST
jgi:hypothetical protein